MVRSDPMTVVVFGSVNSDTSYRMRALPVPGETVLAHTATSSPGGKGANQAIAAVAAGAPTRLVAAVGDDSDRAALLAALADRGVDTDAVVTHPNTRTGRAVVLVDDRGENSIVVLPGANASLDDAAARHSLADLAPGDTLVLQNEIPAAANRAAARLARRAGALVLWNAAPAPATRADLVDDIDLLVVNENELTQIAVLLGVAPGGRAPAGSDILSLLTQTLAALRVEGGTPPRGVCTLGAAGAVFVDGEHSGHVPAPVVTAVDTTAAGDTVVGYLAAHSTLPLEERLRLAGTAGALTVTREGASDSIPSLAEVELLLARLTERTTA